MITYNKKQTVNEVQSLEDVAWGIYCEVYGYDSKPHQAEHLPAIQDWLENGELDGSETIAELAAEYKD